MSQTGTIHDCIDSSSFRDPEGWIFYRDGKICRQVNLSYKSAYDHLIDSGLYSTLVDSALLVSHEEASLNPGASDGAYKVLHPQVVPFISYPYEWSFSQLKFAALTTLKIQRIALDHGMSLKDASAYNIQFMDGKPLLIDTLSFEIRQEGLPWVAYQQFCRHFLAPLALMSYKDTRLSQLLKVCIDGIPLDLAAKLLPLRSLLRLTPLLHIHMHARSQKRYANRPETLKTRGAGLSINALLGLVDNLESGIMKLTRAAESVTWSDYYRSHSYAHESEEHKKHLVSEFLDNTDSLSVWDFGANIGLYSRIAAAKGIMTVAWDQDADCVDINYRQVVGENESNLLPLVLDLSNPSPSLGWNNSERLNVAGRGPADTILALALVHHLAIANNVPLGLIARFFSSLCTWLIIEFVPKSDAMVQLLLATRVDIFPNYTRERFEASFDRHFSIVGVETIRASDRVLYLMKRKSNS